MFDHDMKTSESDELIGKRESYVFVFHCRTHYSNSHLVIRNKIDRLRS